MNNELAQLVMQLYEKNWGVRDYGLARAVVALIRPATLEEVAHPAFLRPLIEEQSAGEWDDKTIDRDVAMFSAAIRALKDKDNAAGP